MDPSIFLESVWGIIYYNLEGWVPSQTVFGSIGHVLTTLNHDIPIPWFLTHPMADLAMALSNGIQVHGRGERGDSLDAVGLAGGGRIAPTPFS